MKAWGLAACLLATPAAAQECRLALLLGLDISTSVDQIEFQQQVEGLATALMSPEVISAFLATPALVAVSIYEWAGQDEQQIITQWRTVKSTLDLDEIAQTVRDHPRSSNTGPTALGHALSFARRHFETAPNCDATTLDISADGPNNDGFPPSSSYLAYDWGDITVNALVIGNSFAPSLEGYFAQNVVRGVGAFTQIAHDYPDYARAMRLKLLRELRPLMLIGALEPLEDHRALP